MSSGLGTMFANALLGALLLLPAAGDAMAAPSPPSSTTLSLQTSNDLEIDELPDTPQPAVPDSSEDEQFPWVGPDPDDKTKHDMDEVVRLCIAIERVAGKWCGPPGSRRKRTSLTRTMCQVIDRLSQQKCS